jgi:hypothetical protein
MHGRSCCCLLVLLSLTLPLCGQENRSDRAQLPGQWSEKDFARDLPLTPPFSRLRTWREGEDIRFPGMHRRFPTRPIHFPPGATTLLQITRAAGKIFAGRVTSVARVGVDRPVETVAVTFHVDRALRGVRAGQEFTIFEWMGLWASGQRYRVGEHVLLLLYPPSKLGLTSSVAGPIGRFAIDPWGRVMLSHAHLTAFRADLILRGKSHARFTDFVRAMRLGPNNTGSNSTDLNNEVGDER